MLQLFPRKSILITDLELSDKNRFILLANVKTQDTSVDIGNRFEPYGVACLYIFSTNMKDWTDMSGVFTTCFLCGHTVPLELFGIHTAMCMAIYENETLMQPAEFEIPTESFLQSKVYKRIENIGEVVTKSKSHEDVFCPICMELVTEVGETSCGHKFCEKCIAEWLEKNTTCPICKKDFSETCKYVLVDENTRVGPDSTDEIVESINRRLGIIGDILGGAGQGF